MGDTFLLDKIHYKLPKIKLCLVNEETKSRKSVRLGTPRDVAKLLQPLKYAPEEHFVSLHLNAKNEVLGIHEVSHGTLSASLVHPREVFKAALVANSFAILVCHNHPSGSKLAPSSEDILTTKQLINAGRLLGISVIDHLIISPRRARNDLYSIRENHGELWTEQALAS